ncbi:PadR family transcriptional regulator [Amycolatopsis regifaucium]|uniref:PadR family transcriptional regulator n=1 Tax=Amycolatopsis regifaucium TaxID=546365 RepID=A0A154M3W9_9PSEU|nr:PadR family transcriptional regulator [Amycolatopsis regifaucium]KZB79311.1 PadR family transcriptional regulator [Amycolatopsis regifaucium]OKA07493.1 PadR family transcriptional regulator [Amycolatopsis regifaucium]
MALRNAILAMLLEGESSGYDLAKSFKASVANFWTATPQQLYRELDKMESQGLVAARVVEQGRRPNKRLFSLTDAGAAELADFTTRAPKPTAIRDELLVQIQAVEAGDDEAIRRAVVDRMATAETKLNRFERLRERLLGDATEPDFLATAPRVGPYLTLARGISFEQGNIRWCEQVLAVLDQRAAVS